MSQEYSLPSEGDFHAFFNICEDILHEELNPVPSDEDASANFDAFFKHCEDIIHEGLQSESVVQVGCGLNPGEARTMKPKLVMNGTKIMLMEIDNVRFIDSINFLPMLLSGLVKALDLPPTIKKGLDRSVFNTQRNMKVDGYFAPDRLVFDQDKSKFYADKSRGACTFYKSKDLVLLKIHPISSRSKGVAAKLMPRRDDPYEIDKAVSPTTYILSDPHTNRKVGKYRVSDLTPFFGRTEEIPEPTVPKKQCGRPRKLLSFSRGRQTEARGGEDECESHGEIPENDNTSDISLYKDAYDEVKAGKSLSSGAMGCRGDKSGLRVRTCFTVFDRQRSVAVANRRTYYIFTHKNAYDEVKAGKSLSLVADKYGINYIFLMRYVRKRDKNGDVEENVNMGYAPHNRVFAQDQERELSKSDPLCRHIYFGFSARATLLENKIAGEEWFRGFRRKSRATSLSRPTSFNRTNVDAFHKKTRQNAKRGSRQVGAFTSPERGTLVTVTFAANALGNAIRPLFVFRRVRHQDHFLRDGPVSSANPSG
ncbi:hypothetical protein CBL_08420 [Carabus blaptoides fortunei]